MFPSRLKSKWFQPAQRLTVVLPRWAAPQRSGWCGSVRAGLEQTRFRAEGRDLRVTASCRRVRTPAQGGPRDRLACPAAPGAPLPAPRRAQTPAQQDLRGDRARALGFFVGHRPPGKACAVSLSPHPQPYSGGEAPKRLSATEATTHRSRDAQSTMRGNLEGTMRASRVMIPVTRARQPATDR
jgi:hypothetical protein